MIIIPAHLVRFQNTEFKDINLLEPQTILADRINFQLPNHLMSIILSESELKIQILLSTEKTKKSHLNEIGFEAMENFWLEGARWWSTRLKEPVNLVQAQELIKLKSEKKCIWAVLSKIYLVKQRRSTFYQHLNEFLSKFLSVANTRPKAYLRKLQVGKWEKHLHRSKEPEIPSGQGHMKFRDQNQDFWVDLLRWPRLSG